MSEEFVIDGASEPEVLELQAGPYLRAQASDAEMSVTVDETTVVLQGNFAFENSVVDNGTETALVIAAEGVSVTGTGLAAVDNMEGTGIIVFLPTGGYAGKVTGTLESNGSSVNAGVGINDTGARQSVYRGW